VSSDSDDDQGNDGEHTPGTNDSHRWVLFDRKLLFSADEPTAWNGRLGRCFERSFQNVTHATVPA
jgi:hypothetical protein